MSDITSKLAKHDNDTSENAIARTEKNADEVVPMSLDSANDSQFSDIDKKPIAAINYVKVGEVQHVTSVNIKAKQQSGDDDKNQISMSVSGTDEM